MPKKSLARILLIVFFASIPIYGNAQNIIPLDQFIKQRNINDPSEFAYLGQRCSSLFVMISAVFRENGTAKDAPTSAAFEQKSTVFRNVALTLDLGVNKKSMEAVIAQIKQFSEIYAKQMSQNKKINNNYFDGFVGNDLEICADIYPRFEELNKKIPK
jgi:hypothetical protein